MGGDHKCPVCQATFTRPQHVARHMRSHTGDRPYKCQCCGDQFARSDLLSRHINKCHANEKPLLAGAGARRKGSASASRATTSKQVCDQCVQGSLPCDGSNPCSKCMQRKTRCTFVKFHRQTAPVGPGHNLQSNQVGGLSSSLASGLGMPPPLHASASTSSSLGGSGLAGPSGLGASSLASNSLLDLELEGHPSHSHRMPPLYSNHAMDRRGYEDDFILGSHSHSQGGAPPHAATAVSSMAEALGYGGAPGFGFPSGLYGSASGAPGGSAAGGGQSGGHGVQHTPSPEHFSGSSVGSWEDHNVGGASSPRRLHSVGQSGTGAGGASGSGFMLSAVPGSRGYGHGVPRGVGGVEPGAGMTLGAGYHQQQQQAAAAAAGHHQQQQHHSHHNHGGHNHGINLNMDLLPGGGGSAAPPSSSSSSAFPVSVQAPSYLLNAQLAQARQQQPQQQQQSQSNSQFRYDLPRYPPSNASNSTSNSRRGSVDVYTDGSSDAGHGSSASGRASVDRLFDSYHQLSGSLPERPSTASTTSSSSAASEHSSQHNEAFPSTYPAIERGSFDDRAEFSSSFGLMSLDDPDVTAGIATDGRPFFSHPDQAHNKLHLENGADMTTPMPAAPGKRDSASMIQFPSGIDILSSDKEGDSKEDLREVWKQYMRTPLSGPDATTPGATLGLLGGGTPRRQRVSSLPSVRTPSVHDSYAMQSMGGMLPPPSLAFPVGGAPLQQYSQHQQMYLAHNLKGKPASGVRTTLHGIPVNTQASHQTDRDRMEDLKSYEAAVLARQTPLNLNLNLHKRARARGTSTSTTGSGNDRSSSQQGGARVSFAPDPQTHDRDSSSPSNISRSPSAGGESESPRPTSGSGGSDQVDFPSMNPYGDGDEVDSPTGTSRPNFKRLPSQTLGPAHAKRAFLGYDRDDEGTDISTSAQNSSNTNTQNITSQDQARFPPNAGNPAALAMMSHPDRVMVSLAERRRRRMSAPAPSNGLFPPPGSLRLDSANSTGA